MLQDYLNIKEISPGIHRDVYYRRMILEILETLKPHNIVLPVSKWLIPVQSVLKLSTVESF